MTDDAKSFDITPSRSLDDLVFPRRPSGVPYAQGDDYDALALLTANGYGTDADTLIGLLDADLGILQAAAARALGAQGAHPAIGALQRLAHNTSAEETARAQAAFALARMGVGGATDALISLLNRSPEASPAPLQAAGALAALGDPQGFPIVRAALDSPSRVTAMVACKQLYAFARLNGRPLPEGGRVDLPEAFRRALARPEEFIVGEARAQMAEVS